MSEYQRFVSYIYEYQNHKKTRNCGFTRVEIREELCRLELHMRLPQYPFTPVFQVFAFVPTGMQLLGILLGNASYQQGTVYAQFYFPTQNINNQGYTTNELGGVLIRCDTGKVYATSWKDVPIDPENFYLPTDESEQEESMIPQITAASLHDEDSPVTPYQEDYPVSDLSGTLPDALPQTPPVTPVDTDENASPNILTTPETDNPESTSTDTLQENKDTIPSKLFSPQWQEIQNRYPQIQPFFDDELQDCVRITLKDLPDLLRLSFPISNNAMLQYSYHTYQHLLLGRRITGNSTHYILGMPGIYNDKERTIASVFGYPYFKPARNDFFCPGQFGYWYQIIG